MAQGMRVSEWGTGTRSCDVMSVVLVAHCLGQWSSVCGSIVGVEVIDN